MNNAGENHNRGLQVTGDSVQAKGLSLVVDPMIFKPPLIRFTSL
jgi:hypothetical protein